ncbi:MFS transporter, partial [Peribacillus sp. NPDC060186]
LFGYMAFYSEYLLKVLLLHPVQAGTISAMVGLGGALVSYLLGVLADKFGRKRIVRWSAFLVLLASVGMFGAGQSIALLCISNFLFGVGIGFPAFVAAQGQDSASILLA